MTAFFKLARVLFFTLLFMLTACGSKKEGNDLTPPGPRQGNSCEAFTGTEQRQAVAALAKLFNSPANNGAMAVAAFALTEKLPFECLQYVEEKLNVEKVK